MHDANALRTLLRADLTVAMKERNADAKSALRLALAAIDNAEAVAHTDALTGTSSNHLAGAVAGVGSTETERLDLSLDDVRAVVQTQIDELLGEASAYESHGQADAADGLRRQAGVLSTYMAP